MRVIWAGPADIPKVALTFDDGPTPGITDGILDLLHAAHARATFFVLGQRIANGNGRARELLKRMVLEGHEVGNHGFTHTSVTQLGRSAVEREVAATQQAVYAACGFAPRWFRPPGGAITFNDLRQLSVTDVSGIVMWSLDPVDWSTPPREVLWRRVATGVRPGSIILLHDTHRETLEALPVLIDLLQARGYELVTVSELIGGTPAP